MFAVDSISNPADEELDALDRELVFSPTVNDSPEFLTQEQIDSYNEHGFLMPFVGLDSSEIGELRRFFDNVLKESQDAGEDGYSINTAHLRFGCIYDLMSNPKILSVVSDLLGPNVVAWGAHFFCKVPQDGKRIAWHQDAVYWPITPTRTVTVWLAIDEASPENANMRFIPESHLFGPIPYKRTVDSSEVLNLIVEDPESYGGKPVDVSLSAGQFSVHSDLLLHGSEANESSLRRAGLTMRYAATEVRAYCNWHNKGIVVSGEDSSCHWANHPRPKK
tara:strand:+ start:88 stop:918 length:831 start_codon:yes stop_codon:yes gene_type:complete